MYLDQKNTLLRPILKALYHACFKRAFTACCFDFTSITLIDPSQRKYCENANACLKRVSQLGFNDACAAKKFQLWRTLVSFVILLLLKKKSSQIVLRARCSFQTDTDLPAEKVVDIFLFLSKFENSSIQTRF